MLLFCNILRWVGLEILENQCPVTHTFFFFKYLFRKIHQTFKKFKLLRNLEYLQKQHLRDTSWTASYGLGEE